MKSWHNAVSWYNAVSCSPAEPQRASSFSLLKQNNPGSE